MELNNSSSYNITPFWLRPRKEYIIENFPEVVRYLKDYNVSAGGQHPDYDSTIECMLELSTERADKLLEQPFCIKGCSDTDLIETLRLMVATLLGLRRQGYTDHNLLLNIIIVLAKMAPRDRIDSLLEMLPPIVRGCELDLRHKEFSLRFENVLESSPEVLIYHLIRSLHFIKSTDNGRYRYVGQGLIKLDSGCNYFSLIGCNERQLKVKKIYPLLLVSDALEISTQYAGTAKPNNVERALKLYNVIANELENMHPQTIEQLKHFSPEDMVVVRVTHVIGSMIVAETITPGYHKIEGKVRYRDLYSTSLPDFKPSVIKVGDCFKCKYIDHPEFKFDIHPLIKDFYFDGIERGQEVNAIYQTSYGSKDMWLSENGTRIIFDPTYQQKGQPIDVEGLKYYNDARENDKGVVFLMHDQYDPSKPIFARAVKGNFPMEEVEGMTTESVDRCFSEDFIKSLTVEPIAEPVDKWGKIDSRVVNTLALLLYIEAMRPSETTLRRLNNVVAAGLLSIALKREVDSSLLKNEVNYISQLTNFMQGRRVSPLAATESITGFEIVRNRVDTVNALTRYKEASGFAPIIRASNTSTIVDISRLDSLINASNSLLNILGATGLEMIKMSIGDTIGVRDEYQPSNNQSRLISYGVEGQSLEFKTSAVIAPNSGQALHYRHQKWAILKTICAFLNSNGGDLLIGVNDAGYAVGISSDINELFSIGRIDSPTEDSYMRYLHENIFDTAFESIDGSYEGLDITQLIVMSIEDEVTLDATATGKRIVRITVKPFKYGVVKIVASGRPDYIKEAYVRNQNSSVAMTASHIDRLTEQRRNALIKENRQ